MDLPENLQRFSVAALGQQKLGTPGKPGERQGGQKAGQSAGQGECGSEGGVGGVQREKRDCTT